MSGWCIPHEYLDDPDDDKPIRYEELRRDDGFVLGYAVQQIDEWPAARGYSTIKERRSNHASFDNAKRAVERSLGQPLLELRSKDFLRKTLSMKL